MPLLTAFQHGGDQDDKSDVEKHLARFGAAKRVPAENGDNDNGDDRGSKC